MENKENDKRKGAPQNNVENYNPIANNVENDTDKKENSSPEKNGKEGKTTVGDAEKTRRKKVTMKERIKIHYHPNYKN